MKNLNSYGVQELSETSTKLTQGGSWLGEALGFAVGALLRYSGPLGGQQAVQDYVIYTVTHE